MPHLARFRRFRGTCSLGMVSFDGPTAGPDGAAARRGHLFQLFLEGLLHVLRVQECPGETHEKAKHLEHVERWQQQQQQQRIAAA